MRILFFLALMVSGGWAALTAAEDTPDIYLEPVTDGVWRHVSHHIFEGGVRYSSNGLIVREGDTLTLIDSAWGAAATQKVLDLVKVEIGLPVTRAVVTHAHDDRISGTDMMEASGIKVFAHPMTRALAAETGKSVPKISLPLTDEPGATTRLGSIEVVYPGVGHTHDNLVVWLPSRKLLFGGCAVRPGDAKGLGYHEEGDPKLWQATIVGLEARFGDAALVVPGHGAVGDAGLLRHTAALLQAYLVN